MESPILSILAPMLVGVTSVVVLASKVFRQLHQDTITVTRADTGQSVTLERPTVVQSSASRSAQARKLLDLVEG